MRSVIIILLASLAWWPARGAGLGSNGLAEARGQASNSLVTFQALITPTNYKLMGFNTFDQIQSATNGEPIPIYTITLTRLRNYGGQEMNELLQETPRAIVPVLVGATVHSSTTVRRDPQAWTTANWGQPRLIRDIMAAYNAIPTNTIPAGQRPFVVEMPVFNRWFVGYTNTMNKLILRTTSGLDFGPATNVLKSHVVTTNAMSALSAKAVAFTGQSN